MWGNSEGPVRLERKGAHVALVVIDRPEVRNAINEKVALQLEAAVEATECDKSTRCIVLTGAGGKVFSAGADLKEVANGRLEKLYTLRGGFAGFTFADRRKPWIAAVEGIAVAGGCEVALACDMIIASETGYFGLPEVTRGLAAAAGGLFRLPRALPRAIALEMIATGQPLPARRAWELGMINHLAPVGSVVDSAIRLAETIASNAPLAVLESLAIARKCNDLEDATLKALSDSAQRRLMRTEDFAEGPRAFVEKRPPKWLSR
jgi:enoyl-CoA hydratase